MNNFFHCRKRKNIQVKDFFCESQTLNDSVSGSGSDVGKRLAIRLRAASSPLYCAAMKNIFCLTHNLFSLFLLEGISRLLQNGVCDSPNKHQNQIKKLKKGSKKAKMDISRVQFLFWSFSPFFFLFFLFCFFVENSERKKHEFVVSESSKKGNVSFFKVIQQTNFIDLNQNKLKKSHTVLIRFFFFGVPLFFFSYSISFGESS